MLCLALVDWSLVFGIAGRSTILMECCGWGLGLTIATGYRKRLGMGAINSEGDGVVNGPCTVAAAGSAGHLHRTG